MSQEDRVLNALIAATKAELRAATLGFESCRDLSEKTPADGLVGVIVSLRTHMLLLEARLEALQAAVEHAD